MNCRWHSMLTKLSQPVGLSMHLGKIRVMFNRHAKPPPVIVDGKNSRQLYVSRKEDCKSWCHTSGGKKKMCLAGRLLEKCIASWEFPSQQLKLREICLMNMFWRWWLTEVIFGHSTPPVQRLLQCSNVKVIESWPASPYVTGRVTPSTADWSEWHIRDHQERQTEMGWPRLSCQRAKN